ncbi:TPA: signal recognition particle-docking protein FtsY [Providencia stuartii]
MAKDKKKGFFSWLGFGRKDEKEAQQQEAEQQKKIDADKEIELQKQDIDAAKMAEEEAERQYQEKKAEEQAAIKAAEEAAERQYQAELAAIKKAEEEAERQRQAELAAIKAAEDEAERQRQEAARLAEEEAERQHQAELAAAKAAEEEAERQRQEAIRLAEEEAERQHQAELAAAKAAEEEAERQEAARLAEEEAERQHQAELAAAKAAEEEAERQRQEAIRLAEEEAERQHQAELAAAKAAEEEAERQRQEAIRLAEEEAERQRQAELAAAKAAEEEAERQRQEAARLAEEETERQHQAELAAAKAAEEETERQRQEAARLAEEEAERQHQAEEQAKLEAQDIVALRDEVLSEQEEPKQTEQEKPKKEGFFARLKKGLLKTRQNLGSGFLGLFTGKKIDDDLFDELEEQLLIADVGVDTTRKIIDNLTAHASRKELKDAEALYSKLREEMSDILAGVDKPLVIEDKKPYVILMVGVNGVGKTTTIGKLARQYQSEGKTVMLAAGDTFRAAAVEQLQVWGERNRIPVVAQHTGADPASVIFDAIQSAKAKGVDVLIADTAGRLQNKAHLMEELKKIVRVMKKLDEEAPHEIMLTLDASTGQNAVSQAKLFNDAVGLTGITLTKLDGTAKGGVIFSIADQFGIPIRYIGIGEGIEDLRPFKADDFIEALFAREE